MSHRDDCPDPYAARSRARRDANLDVESGFGQRYGSPFPDCHEADRSYRRAYEEEFEERGRQLRQEEARREQRRREAAIEEEQREIERLEYEAQLQQQQEEEVER